MNTGTLTLTYEQAVADLRKVVKMAGEDYVYEEPGDDGCVYFAHEWDVNAQEPLNVVPSCAIGRLLSVERYSGAHLIKAGLNDQTGVAQLFDLQVLASPDPRVQRLLEVMQLRQDARRPYGECLAHAIAAAERVDLPQQGLRS